MIWQQSSSASLEVIGAHVFVCFSSKNEHSQVSPCSLSLIFCSSFTDLFHTSHYSTAYSILLISLCPQAHIFLPLPYLLNYCCSTHASPPPFSHVFHSLFSVLPSNNCVQILARDWLPKNCIYQDKHKINTHPTQTQHTGSLADLPTMLAHAPSLVITELKWQKNGYV